MVSLACFNSVVFTFCLFILFLYWMQRSKFSSKVVGKIIAEVAAKSNDLPRQSFAEVFLQIFVLASGIFTVARGNSLFTAVVDFYFKAAKKLPSSKSFFKSLCFFLRNNTHEEMFFFLWITELLSRHTLLSPTKNMKHLCF